MGDVSGNLWRIKKYLEHDYNYLKYTDVDYYEPYI